MKNLLITWTAMAAGSWIAFYTASAFIVGAHFLNLSFGFTNPLVISSANILTTIFVLGAMLGYIVKHRNKWIGAGILVLVYIFTLSSWTLMTINIVSPFQLTI